MVYFLDSIRISDIVKCSANFKVKAAFIPVERSLWLMRPSKVIFLDSFIVKCLEISQHLYIF